MQHMSIEHDLVDIFFIMQRLNERMLKLVRSPKYKKKKKKTIFRSKDFLQS